MRNWFREGSKWKSVFLRKKASKYKNLEVKCYVLSRVGWKHERTGINIRAFCLKHFPKSCHMRSIFAKRHVQRKSTIWAENNFSQKSPRSVWECSGGIPDLSGPICKPFPLKSILKKSHFSWKLLKINYYEKSLTKSPVGQAVFH